ncbi:MAG: hypothetical protein K2O16_19810 [Lachnospiraceae bacterium]|nr:hypothetical protein [Lachnospiraceae bacterium]
MSDTKDFCAGGYRFHSTGDAERARLDQKRIEYLEEKVEGKNAQDMLAAYDRILDEKVFATPVGWEYLRELQERLRSLGIEDKDIRPIPLFVVFDHGIDGETIFKRAAGQPAHPPRKGGIKISVCINILLAVLVAAMFWIALNSENPNILNYKTQIENKYAMWDQELTRREKEIRQKEAELENNTKWQEDFTE